MTWGLDSFVPKWLIPTAILHDHDHRSSSRSSDINVHCLHPAGRLLGIRGRRFRRSTGSHSNNLVPDFTGAASRCRASSRGPLTAGATDT